MSRRPRRLRSRFASLNPFSRPVDRAMEFKRGRQLRCEALEERQLLAVDVFIDSVTGFVTIMDDAGLGGGEVDTGVQEDNNVTLSLGNFDPDGGQAAVAQDGLLITDPDGVNALTFGMLQVSDTQVFVPQNFDFQFGGGENIQPVLTSTVVIDLQDGDDTLTFTDDVDAIPVVTNYDLRGGSNGAFSDVLNLEGTADATEDVTIQRDDLALDVTNISGYGGVAIRSRGYEQIFYDGVGNDDSLTVNLGNGNTTARVQNAVPLVADSVATEVLPLVVFQDLMDFTLSSEFNDKTAVFTIDQLQGATNYMFAGAADDELVIEGGSGNTLVTASLDAAGELQISSSTTTIHTLNMGAGDLLRVETKGGDDTLTVNVGGTGLISTPIFFDGGTGTDRLDVVGVPAINVQRVTYSPGLQPDEGRLTYDQNIGEAGLDMVIDFDNLEPVVDNVNANDIVVNGNGNANQITYADNDANPANNSNGLVSIDGFEVLQFNSKNNLIINAGAGDDTVVVNNPDRPDSANDLDTVTVNGGDGNDVIRFEALPDETTTPFTGAAADGGAGNDVIDGSSITVPTSLNLIGGAGNDTLTGGPAVDGLVGDAGDDTIIDSPGDDVINAGAGNDTLVVRGTFLGELISVIQAAPSAVVNDSYTLTVLGPTAGTKEIGKAILGAAPSAAANTPTLERIVVEGEAGDDIIRVGHADEYGDLNANNGVPGQTIPFEVVGNGPNASDRLVVPDLGLGDLVIQRQGADQRSGSITVGPMAPIDYTEMEFVNVTPLDPISGGTGTDGLGRLVVFKDDPFESNNTRPNATFLGSGPTVNVDPTIDPSGIPEFGVPGDNDFYQFVAQETGTLDLQLYFETIGTLANGRPGLPVDGDLIATVLDSDGVPVSIATASDLLDPNDIKIGKRVVVPVVRNNTYYLRVEGQVGDNNITAINVYNFTAITTAAPIPELVDLQAASDTGRNNTDDVTKDTTPTFNIILDDDRIDEFANVDLTPDTVNDNAPTAGFDYGVEVFNNAVSIGFAFYTGVGNTWEFTAQVGDLNEGDFNYISAAVWIRDLANPAQIGRHLLSDAMQITLDTQTPLVSFGLPDATNDQDGLEASSDSGVLTDPATYADRITNDATPALWGRAEANTVVRVYHDNDGDGVIDLATDTFLGQTVAVPYDGNDAYVDDNGDPLGFWRINSVLDLNAIPGVRDGLRQLLVTAEDVAGNPMPMDGEIADGVGALDIFIDTQGPQVYDPAGSTEAVHPTGFPEYDLFDPKPSENGFTPLIDSITIHVRDLPLRSNADPNFLYVALQEEIAEIVGNYTLVGDHVGTIGIVDVEVTNVATVNNQQATATIVLTFADFLPDDRYTLTISDNLVDPAGNNLDGESNATGPLDNPVFPSGDAIPGGNFAARFTVDSRPEIGTFIPTTIAIDINGNFVWDPANAQIGNDATNVDLTFTMDRPGLADGGFATHDTVFAGRFTNLNGDDDYYGEGVAAGGVALPDRLFDQLAVYGYSIETGEHRWLIDLDSDGVANVYSSQPLLSNFNVAGALPIAGNFDNNDANGDEIGLYYAGNWGFDFNRNYRIDAGEIVANTGLFGVPIVGDFDGNGVDDVGVFNNNTFKFAMSSGGFGNFTSTPQFQWGFSGVLERPVAADMDQDGIDDIGLWVPRNTTQPLRQTAEWYFLLSGFAHVGQGSVAAIAHPFEPVPFGNDLYAEFGDELALPIVGNFDPPVAAAKPDVQTSDLPGDFDSNGVVDRGDYDVWKANRGQTGDNIRGDANGDGQVNLADYTVWRDHEGMASDPSTAAVLAGDYDGSGYVDEGDYDVWKSDFGKTGTGLAGDGNGDGRVTLADLTMWRENVGAGLPTAAPALALAATDDTPTVSDEPVLSSVVAPLQEKTTATTTSSNIAVETVDAMFAEDEDELLLLPVFDIDDELVWPEAAKLESASATATADEEHLDVDLGW